MLVLEIAFVLVNLAVPYWLWSKKTPHTLPVVEREAIGQAMFRVIEASGGFPPCDTQAVVDATLDLCDQSRSKYTQKSTMAFERAGVDVVFSCEVRKDEVRFKWLPERDGQPDLDCQSNRDEQIAYIPSFTFNLKGQLRTISYTAPNGKRAATHLQGCRRKLASAKSMQDHIPPSEQEFLAALTRLPNDPADVMTKNRICLIYDPAMEWEPFRKAYDK